MSKDKVLLELAAKSAGTVLEWGIVEGGKQLQPATKCFYRNQHGIRMEWNPLDDDGDALRLVVRLNAHISIDFDRPRNDVVVGMNGAGDGACAKESGNDPYAAARRAIVRAAADVGSQK